MASFYDRMDENRRNSYLLMSLVFVVCLAAVWGFSIIFFGDSDLGFALGALFSGGYVAATYFAADRMILSVSGAREAKKEEFPYLVNVVEGLSIAAGVPMPKVYVIDDPAPNAFAVGTSPDKASIAFTTGLLSMMNRAELEGVAAHELSHIKNFDSRMATIAVAMVGLVAILSDLGMRSVFWGGMRGGGRGRDRGGGLALIGLAIIVLAPIFSQLVRLALSRQREFLADASGAQLTRYPEGLASALEKMKNAGTMVQHASDATASLYFANPLSMGGMFSTHPPMEERIKRLREM
ncbi:MAG: M48 family metalloprotease [Candidatus Micrarchaeota archaeon]|nr:M48 family metalloprotease [Candidatus Micrarchaeota archaeon]